MIVANSPFGLHERSRARRANDVSAGARIRLLSLARVLMGSGGGGCNARRTAGHSQSVTVTARQQFEALYDAHAGAVLAYALRRTSSSAADDVVSEVFLVAWRRSADVPVEPRVWLLSIARKVLANQRRGHARQSALRDRLGAQPSHGGVSGVRDDGDGRVLRALAVLGERDREALMLLAWEGLSSREAAVVLDISEQAYRVRLHRARTRLARALANAEVSTAEAGEPTTPREAV
jgi:RNA polymerase sigma-70 factor, ECF subfamily